MAIKINNNAYGTLAGSISNVAVTIVLTAGHGARFPTLGASDYCYATLVDSSGNVEIVKITAITTDTLTVVRGQDGTAGRAYSSGDRLEIRPCNAAMQALAQEAPLAVSAAGTDTYTATLAPVPNGYNTSQIYFIKIGTANTSTAPTINLNSYGAKTIKKEGSLALVAGDMPAGGVALLLYNGTDMILLNPARPTSALPAGAMIAYAGVGSTELTGFYFPVGQTKSRTTDAALYAALNKSGTVTMTIASPCVVTWTANVLQTNDPIKFSTTSALPTGVSAGTTYYVKRIDANTFNLAATPGGANINSSGSQSGVHTGIHSPYGDGDGTTTFNLPDMRGRSINVRDDLGGTAANRVTSGNSGINGNVPGAAGGAETVTLSTAQLAVHAHSNATYGSHLPYGAADNITFSQLPTATGNTDFFIGTGSTPNAGSGSLHTNMHPVLVTPYIIKT